MDLAGLLQIKGRMYTMLVVVDRCICYTWLWSFPRMPKSEEIKKAIDKIISDIYNLNTKKTLSDNGTQFTSKNWSQYCKRNGMKLILTAYKNPQSNGLTEQKIQETKKKMLMYMFNNKKTNLNQIVQRVTKAVIKTEWIPVGAAPENILKT
jgi:transposase InsO family protein